MKLSDLLANTPSDPVAPVPGEEVRSWMKDIDTRVRRVEKLCWTLMGLVPVLQFGRACVEG